MVAILKTRLRKDANIKNQTITKPPPVVRFTKASSIPQDLSTYAQDLLTDGTPLSYYIEEFLAFWEEFVEDLPTYVAFEHADSEVDIDEIVINNPYCISISILPGKRVDCSTLTTPYYLLPFGFDKKQLLQANYEDPIESDSDSEYGDELNEKPKKRNIAQLFARETQPIKKKKPVSTNSLNGLFDFTDGASKNYRLNRNLIETLLLKNNIPERLSKNPENQHLFNNGVIVVDILYYNLIEGNVQTKSSFNLSNIAAGTLLDDISNTLKEIKQFYIETKKLVEVNENQRLLIDKKHKKMRGVITKTGFSKFDKRYGFQEVMAEYIRAIDSFDQEYVDSDEEEDEEE